MFDTYCNNIRIGALIRIGELMRMEVLISMGGTYLNKSAY